MNLPQYVHSESGDEDVTVAAVIHEMFGPPKKQERQYRADGHSDTDSQIIAS